VYGKRITKYYYINEPNNRFCLFLLNRAQSSEEDWISCRITGGSSVRAMELYARYHKMHTLPSASTSTSTSISISTSTRRTTEILLAESESGTQAMATVGVGDHHHDQETDDPNLVENVLSRELMKLSFQDRNDFQEEIHGVRCIAPTETPELLRRSLYLLQWEIDNAVPFHQKQAYLQSQQQQQQAAANTNTYVNTEEFRLRFLRYELFDVPKAAVRMARFLDLVLEFYGDYALQRPIRITDFSKHELKQLNKGKYQFLPYRDRGGIAGRRVLCIFPDMEWELITPYVRNKIMMYFTWVAGNDVEVQKEGIVVLAWFDKSFEVSRRPAIQTKDHELLTVRPCAIHMCTPNTPFYRLRRSILTMRIGRHNRTRLVVHKGENVELYYELQSYGIPTDQVPITYTGKIKTVHLKQWMKVRELIEGSKRYNVKSGWSSISISSSSSSSSSSSDGSDCETYDSAEAENARNIIESPYLSDIIFRKGASMISHRGNVTLRTLIVAKVRKELLRAQPNDKAQHPNSISNNNKKIKTGRFVSEIIREVREATRANEAAGIGKACRFLVWDEAGWWIECLREEDIHTRIEYIARGIRNTVVKNHKTCAVFAGTMAKVMVTPPTTKSPSTTALTPTKETTRKPPKTPEAIDSPIAPIRYASLRRCSESETTTVSVSSYETTQGGFVLPTQHQHGGTYIFRSQDHSIKKQRLIVMGGEDDDRTKGTAAICEAECFGMKFNSTNDRTWD
jgi:hypothetical protein